MSAKARGWCFTLNNYSDDEVKSVQQLSLDCRYIIYGKEVAPSTGTPHLQGYLYFSNPRTMRGVSRLIPRAWLCMSNGTAHENQLYCNKDRDFWEHGVPVKQGERADLSLLRDSVMAGDTSVDEIAVEHPAMFHQYGRTLERIEDIALRKKFRTEMTEGIWIFGPTGVGKSYDSFIDFDPAVTYVYPEDNNWWDGYKGQPTVLFNEFRGGVAYAFLLRLVDQYPEYVRRRNREPVPFLAKKVVVTSALPPEKVYHNLAASDSLDQLYRRFKVFYKGSRDAALVVHERPASNPLFDDQHYLHAHA